jgi:hypothetical protein
MSIKTVFYPENYKAAVVYCFGVPPENLGLTLDIYCHF